MTGIDERRLPPRLGPVSVNGAIFLRALIIRVLITRRKYYSSTTTALVRHERFRFWSTHRLKILTRMLGRLFRQVVPPKQVSPVVSSATWFRGRLVTYLACWELHSPLLGTFQPPCSCGQCIEAADIRPRRIPRIRETFNRGNQSLDELGTCAFPGRGEVHATAFRCVPAHLDDFSRR